MQAAARQHGLGQGAVVIVAAQGRVAAGGQHLEHASGQAQDGNIKSAAAQVVDGINTFRSIVQSVGDGRCRRFIDQAQHLQAGQLRRVFGGLALGVIKIGGYGDHRAKNIVVKTVFGTKTQRGQNFSAHLDGAFFARDGVHFDHSWRVDERVGQVLGVGHIGQAAAHQAFDRDDGVGRVGALLGQRVLPDLAALGVDITHRAGQQDLALAVGQAFGHAVAHSSYQRMRGAQVNTDGNAPGMRVGRLPGFRNLQQGHK